MKNMLMLISALMASPSIYGADNAPLTIHLERDPQKCPEHEPEDYNCKCCMGKTDIVLDCPKKLSDKELIEEIKKKLPHIAVTEISSHEDQTIALIRPTLKALYLLYVKRSDSPIRANLIPRGDLPKKVGCPGDTDGNEKILAAIKQQLPDHCHPRVLTIASMIADPGEQITPEGESFPANAAVAYIQVNQHEGEIAHANPAAAYIQEIQQPEPTSLTKTNQ